MQDTHRLQPVDGRFKSLAGKPQTIETMHHSPGVYTMCGYGMVGTGRTPGEAKADLFEKIKTAGQA